jgi:hypothetical protein
MAIPFAAMERRSAMLPQKCLKPEDQLNHRDTESTEETQKDKNRTEGNKEKSKQRSA